MNKKEQAIEDLKNLLKYRGRNICLLDIDFEAIEILLNLIEKQQKEYDLLLNGYNKLVQEHIKAEKVIDRLADIIYFKTPEYEEENYFEVKEFLKDYFYKEIENE